MTTAQTNTDELRTINDWVEDAQAQGGPIDLYSGKRREPRRIWDAMLDVHVLTGATEGSFHYATARDISGGGMGIQCRQKLEPGTWVGMYVSGCDQGATAIVRHCTETIGGYVIGLEFVARLKQPSFGRPTDSSKSRRGHSRYVNPARLVG